MSVDKERFREACGVLRDEVTITDYLEKENHVSFPLTDRVKMIRCPFPDHDDSTPSFSYDLDKQVFNCFGCDRSGDIVNLHYHFNRLDNERYTRVKAVRELARNYSVTIPDIYNRDKQLETGKVNKYKRSRVDVKNLKDEFYKEKIRGYETIIKNMTDKKRIKIYRMIDDMHFGKTTAKEVFQFIRSEIHS